MPDDDSLTLPLPFDELSGDVDLQPPQTPWKNTRLTLREPSEEGLWLNHFLGATGSEFDASSSLNSPKQNLEPHCEMPLARTLQDHSSMLVEYYFKEVCGMMSCYDGQLNPYRTMISNVWSGSPSLYYITQSMAAACLSEVSPNFSSIGLQLQNQAALCLSGEIRGHQIETSSLLALVMLGMSRCWHNPGDIGQSEFDTLARIVLSSKACESNTRMADEEKRFFFHNSLVYWQVLLSFISDREPDVRGIRHNRPQPAPSDELESHEPQMPHPQTGVGVEVQMLAMNVGNLVRKERKRIHSRRFASRNDIDQAHKAILEAEQLQSRLSASQLPRKNTIVDSGDDLTPVDHLIKIAEAYRCTGLLQLYRNFPDLLLPYASLNDPTHEFITFSPIPDNSPNPEAGLPENAWLIYLALHILDLVQDIPVSSTSRSIQPFLLVSICSELALDRTGCSVASAQKLPLASLASSPRLKTPVTELDILRARRSIISRLSSFENMLAAKPIQQMLLLVKETWACMDKNQRDTYWMDVMMDKGYETLMG
ncbi:uncharacterized protein N7498_005753 [Penicillium cinerascens]|uniref:Transcription factor domain-containing protein n=1 Tax=Penicillium cinerascens TaxID=70096 RepID=A0A9W9T0H1_9EURO|nr:uncharacterized protein N7498_005753 [Penicillium cinerascens]KAJ5204874.1 hypothetical protein N7498_005753 [Penicillium cinerascens]